MMALAANNVSVSEALGQACLLQDGVRRVARLNVSVHRESFARDRAFPNLVIAIALPVELTCLRIFERFIPGKRLGVEGTTGMDGAA